MLKSLFTYTLAVLLLSSLAIPTIISLSDYEICETSLLLDIEEDTDSKENSKEAKEVKILSVTTSFLSVCKVFPNEKISTYNAKLYQTIYNSLDSPPPELV